jgi:ureidoglycolate lyase
MVREIKVRPLTRQEFEPFGDIIEVDSESETVTINDGYATRYHDLGTVDVDEADGRPLINIFRGRPRPLPLTIHMMERHPLASQAFMPLHNNQFVVVVAPPSDTLDPSNLSAFITNGKQGVNYARGVWHFPLLVLGGEQDFLIIDRGGDGDNCEENYFDKDEICILKL